MIILVINNKWNLEYGIPCERPVLTVTYCKFFSVSKGVCNKLVRDTYYFWCKTNKFKTEFHVNSKCNMCFYVKVSF